jgi:PEP-CTERM motif-containing protein
MTESSGEVGGAKSPRSWAIRLPTAALLVLMGSGAEADVLKTFDLSGSFITATGAPIGFSGTIDLDFSNDTANSIDVTVDGLPAYNQNPSLRFASWTDEAVVDVSDSSVDSLTLDFGLSKLGTLLDFNGGVNVIVGGLALFPSGTEIPGFLFDPTGSMTLDPPGPVITATVPEPSTWAMMLLGFAGLGFVAGGRRAIGFLAGKA